MSKRNITNKLQEYKGYSAYYYYDDEDKLFVGHVYNSTDGEFTYMVTWYDAEEKWMEPIFHSMVDDYITFKKQMEYKYGVQIRKYEESER